MDEFRTTATVRRAESPETQAVGMLFSDAAQDDDTGGRRGTQGTIPRAPSVRCAPPEGLARVRPGKKPAPDATDTA